MPHPAPLLTGKVAKYCSRACQRGDWQDHKRACGTLARQGGAGGDHASTTAPDPGTTTASEASEASDAAASSAPEPDVQDARRRVRGIRNLVAAYREEAEDDEAENQPSGDPTLRERHRLRPRISAISRIEISSLHALPGGTGTGTGTARSSGIHADPLHGVSSPIETSSAGPTQSTTPRPPPPRDSGDDGGGIRGGFFNHRPARPPPRRLGVVHGADGRHLGAGGGGAGGVREGRGGGLGEAPEVSAGGGPFVRRAARRPASLLTPSSPPGPSQNHAGQRRAGRGLPSHAGRARASSGSGDGSTVDGGVHRYDASGGRKGAPSARPLPDPAAVASFDLPPEILDLVLRRLSPFGLAAAGGVCRAWREAAESDELWAVHLAARGHPFPRSLAGRDGSSSNPGSGGTTTYSPGEDRVWGRAPSAGGGGLDALRSLRLSRNRPAPRPLPPACAVLSEEGETIEDIPGGGKRAFARAAALERRWRDGQFATCDLHKHTWAVECLEFVHVPRVGRVLVSGGWDGQVFAWHCWEQAARGLGWDVLRHFHGPRAGWVTTLAATPERVAAGDTNGHVWVWSYGSSTPLRAFHHGVSVTKVRFVPGRWPQSTASRRRRARVPLEREREPEGEMGGIQGSTARTPHPPPPRPRPPPAGGGPITRPIRNVRPPRAFGSIGGGLGTGVPRASSSVSREEDEEDGDEVEDVFGGMTLVASAGTDADVKIWDVLAGTQLAVLRGHADAVWHMSVFSAPAPLEAGPLRGVGGGRPGAGRASTPTLLTASRDSTIRVWRVPTGPDALDILPEGQVLELRSEATLRGHDDAILAMDLYDPTLETISSDRVPGAVYAHAQTPRDSAGRATLCATGGAEGVAIVWDVAAGAVVAIMRGHTHGILAVTFAVWAGDPSASGRPGGLVRTAGADDPNPTTSRSRPVGGGGRDGCFLWLVTGSADKTVRLWDPLSGRCAAVIADHSAPVTTVRVVGPVVVTIAPGDGVMAYVRGVEGEDGPIRPAKDDISGVHDVKPRGNFKSFGDGHPGHGGGSEGSDRAGPGRTRLREALETARGTSRDLGSDARGVIADSLYRSIGGGDDGGGDGAGVGVSGLVSALALMDGAGSGFSSCIAMDGEMLAVGTKTGTVQLLDFRPNPP